MEEVLTLKMTPVTWSRNHSSSLSVSLVSKPIVLDLKHFKVSHFQFYCYVSCLTIITIILEVILIAVFRLVLSPLTLIYISYFLI